MYYPPTQSFIQLFPALTPTHTHPSQIHSPSLPPPIFSSKHSHSPTQIYPRHTLCSPHTSTHTFLSAECSDCRWCVADDAVILYLCCEKAFGISELRALIVLTFMSNTTNPVYGAECFHPFLNSAIVFQGISLSASLPPTPLFLFLPMLFLFHVATLDHGVSEGLAILLSLHDLTLALITSLRG